ncbi:MAG: hypothetical protein K9J12_00650 [Melioribacteraceae bacterium]|nr:hypothetical protein [Melioribacteraceae bacterium]MCF8265995.1 hypothetical protein [Melioribacteraceae bacterium]MCF8414173.1 hypothetical protein [Melioribacteraceae bacterium]MCF8432538.1 hypothetical protein [Melioribacteraceae bacterium]
MEELIPIIFFLILGAVVITFIYYRSQERQMMIEKGMSYQEMIDFLKSKRDGNLMLKIGTVVLFFGFGLGMGLMLQSFTGDEFYVPFFMITLTGLGFIVAHILSKKYSDQNDK